MRPRRYCRALDAVAGSRPRVFQQSSCDRGSKRSIRGPSCIHPAFIYIGACSRCFRAWCANYIATKGKKLVCGCAGSDQLCANLNFISIGRVPVVVSSSAAGQRGAASDPPQHFAASFASSRQRSSIDANIAQGIHCRFERKQHLQSVVQLTMLERLTLSLT